MATTPSYKNTPSSSKTSQINLSSNSSNPNQDICDILSELAEYERALSNKAHVHIAYMKAIKVFSKLNKRLESGKVAMTYRGIGKKIASVVDEILITGKLKLLDKVRNDKKRIKALNDLKRVTGIGPAKANRLYKDGITNIDLLLQNQNKLTHHQQIGLKYLNDLEKKIPRKEIIEVEQIFKKTLNDLDPKYKVTICGSYRRGVEFSGDIDVLITHPTFTSYTTEKNNVTMKAILDALKKVNLVIDTLAGGEKKFMGVCKVGKIARRLDIRLSPFDQYYCGVLYFTGSGLFNTRMREYASRQGFTLNEYTLRPKNSEGNLGVPVNITKEEDIFKAIDYPYKKPEERDLLND